MLVRPYVDEIRFNGFSHKNNMLGIHLVEEISVRDTIMDEVFNVEERYKKNPLYTIEFHMMSGRYIKWCYSDVNHRNAEYKTILEKHSEGLGR